MYLNPEVAIIQHSSGVMKVVGDYFENGVTFFTNLIYSAICFAVGNGEVAPFVGHNAFLRWEAIQSVARKSEDGYELFWSESHVSEDFDMALRLQIKGNIVRLASYHGSGFQEGVSLTVYDELNRWEK
jgi:cellulose synthase/poly-beta-1,6-N-acetylglucosamine synthase-like glycosyltransferase